MQAVISDTAKIPFSVIGLNVSETLVQSSAVYIFSYHRLNLFLKRQNDLKVIQPLSFKPLF